MQKPTFDGYGVFRNPDNGVFSCNATKLVESEADERVKVPQSMNGNECVAYLPFGAHSEHMLRNAETLVTNAARWVADQANRRKLSDQKVIELVASKNKEIANRLRQQRVKARSHQARAGSANARRSVRPSRRARRIAV